MRLLPTKFLSARQSFANLNCACCSLRWILSHKISKLTGNFFSWLNSFHWKIFLCLYRRFISIVKCWIIRCMNAVFSELKHYKLNSTVRFLFIVFCNEAIIHVKTRVYKSSVARALNAHTWSTLPRRCHDPSWTSGHDNLQVGAAFRMLWHAGTVSMSVAYNPTCRTYAIFVTSGRWCGSPLE